MAARHTNRSERLLVIEQMLARSATGLRAVELAAACDVDRRTVYRDLALLNELGVPIFQKDGRFFINRDAYRAPLRLSCDEAMLLLLAASALSTYPSVNTTSLTNAIANLSQIVPEAAAVHAGYLGSVVTREQEPHHVILDRLIRAWAEQRRVQIEYTSRDGTKRRLTEMAVYFIEPRASGSLYAVGYDMVSARIRALKLRRITRVDVLVTTYQTPSHFDPRPYLRRMRQRRDRAESA